MATKFIGLIVGTESNAIYSVVNPDDDEHLDHSSHLELGNVRNEPVRMVKVPRERYGYMGEMSADDVYNLITQWYVDVSDIYQGSEKLDWAVT